MPIKTAFAVIACLLYERTGSLYPGIALHCLVDGTGYEASVSDGGIWIVPLAFATFGLIVLLRHRFRAPTAAELAAVDRLAIRLGYRSPRWVLGMLGGVLIVIAFAITLINGSITSQASSPHSTPNAVIEMLAILGLLTIIAAIIWRLLRRPTQR